MSAAFGSPPHRLYWVTIVLLCWLTSRLYVVLPCWLIVQIRKGPSFCWVPSYVVLPCWLTVLNQKCPLFCWVQATLTFGLSHDTPSAAWTPDPQGIKIVMKSGDFIRGDQTRDFTAQQLGVVLSLCYDCMYQALDTCNRSKVIETPLVAVESLVRSPRKTSPDFIKILSPCGRGVHAAPEYQGLGQV